MKRYFENLANALLGQSYSNLNSAEQRVIDSIAGNTSVTQNINESFHESLTLGQRMADKIAAFGGSWTFIVVFFAFIVVWILINTLLWVSNSAFDPYPFILLNLGLSSLAAFQAPIIMMSQSRQVSKDRLEQKNSYEINLKLELELMRVHKKVDKLLAFSAKSSVIRSAKSPMIRSAKNPMTNSTVSLAKNANAMLTPKRCQNIAQI
ncbi:MAG: putative membrane protein [Pseudohongiellaceae bacterium]